MLKMSDDEKERQSMYIKMMASYEPVECYMDDINDLTRKELDIFAQDHPETFIGNINLDHVGDTGDLKVYKLGDFIYNFGAAFAVPVNDGILVKMTKDRKARDYTGTADDYILVTAIIDRIHEIGGILLTWV